MNNQDLVKKVSKFIFSRASRKFKLKPSDKIILMAFADMCSHHGIFPKQTTLQIVTELSLRTVKSCIKTLRSLNLIVSKKYRGRNYYGFSGALLSFIDSSKVCVDKKPRKKLLTGANCTYSNNIDLNYTYAREEPAKVGERRGNNTYNNKKFADLELQINPSLNDQNDYVTFGDFLIAKVELEKYLPQPDNPAKINILLIGERFKHDEI